MKCMTLMALVLCGCGAEQVTMLSANVRIDALLADDTASLTLHALDWKRTDGVFVTCSSLMLGDIKPDDARIEVLAVTEGTIGDDLVLKDVAAGEKRIVFVEARNSSDGVIGVGCADGVVVEGGEKVSVDILVHPI
ncbi:MAG: hypothetical protein A2289_05340 [Deltaproteobacteria bacterium RIFOXYA12_FULL_58_15]|nr:MAG: hypothetical protein A2289_05340 [Deltaproteobacteria bacterium RIFOXYA12_FULL_58_15]OGR13087.1 MAG: hypothetical protein A2341_08395 [Deltaproteobacteria bacterium RIFOXYB12_FULL_58_9]